MGFFKSRSKIITYTIDKTIKNNLYISVQNGEVVVCAPWYFSRNQIQEIVEEKKRWILEKIKEYEVKKEEYVNSGIVKILGQNCNLKIRYKNIRGLKVDIESGVIKIELPYKYKRVNNDELLELLTQKIYNVIAEREIERAMEKTRILLGYAPEDYKLERMKNTLGKCDNSTIIINPDIVKYKEEIIDYVVLHEFIHLKHKTHSKRFYEKLKQYEPNYEKYIDVISGLQY
ncbi:MAG: M48 family metallopeptidase [Clostridia bacterium]|nr:M48 family metallopeptidase [Clostridia bacterium]